MSKYMNRGDKPRRCNSVFTAVTGPKCFRNFEDDEDDDDDDGEDDDDDDDDDDDEEEDDVPLLSHLSNHYTPHAHSDEHRG